MDESTGYVLSRSILHKLASEMPVTAKQLQASVTK